MLEVFKKKSKFRIILISFLVLFIISCNQKSKEQKEAAKLPIEMELVRLDQILYESDVQDFPKIRREFSSFFPSQFPDSIFINKITNPLYQQLYREVKKTFSDDKELVESFVPTLQMIKYHFPQIKLPNKMIGLISDMDYENKVIFTDSVLIVSLDLYLGAEHKFYDDFYDYQRQNFRKEMMVSDLVSDFSTYVVEPNKDRSLMAQMIFHGKELYLKDILLPNTLEEHKIGYTKAHLDWCKENEENIWRYFIENNLLYDTSFHTYQRFLEPGPFSKFYMEFDNETPGRIGAWVGWQIVRNLMNNNKVPLQQMLQMDAKEILELSKYKPKN